MVYIVIATFVNNFAYYIWHILQELCFGAVMRQKECPQPIILTVNGPA
jgi:hypothetical protein